MAQIDPKLKRKIKKEYIMGKLSLSELSTQYKVSKSAICTWINREGWRAEKSAHYIEAAKKAREAERTDDERILDKLTVRTAAIYESADLLLKKVVELLKLPDALSPRDLKSLSSTLLDIKLLHDIKPIDETGGEKEVKVTIIGGDGIDA